MKYKNTFLAITLALLLAPASGSLAEGGQSTAKVHGMRVWRAPENTRVVFDLSAPVKYSVFTVSAPDRVVIDLESTQLNRELPPLASDSSLLKSVRTASANGKLRLVLDVNSAVEPRFALLKPHQQHGNRLLVELIAKPVTGAKTSASSALSAPSAIPASTPAAVRDTSAPAPAIAATKPASSARAPATKTTPASGREVIVAIDAGHGGEDPGAIGKKGTREKDITLAIAKKLAREINQREGIRAVLTRDGDYFIPLRDRMDNARDQKADLFVSIHADSYKNHHVKGSTVYVLSERGASSEAARWLAAQENASDFVGGVTLDDKDKMVQSVLLDMSQTGVIEASAHAAHQVLHDLNRVGNIHRSEVQRAGFVVLKSPDIPSLLVETAFLSNPDEEQKLNNQAHQDALAVAITNGIQRYFESYPPVGTQLAAKRVSRMNASR